LRLFDYSNIFSFYIFKKKLVEIILEELLGYWVVGLLGYWVIGLLGYWVIGLLSYSVIQLLGIRHKVKV
jgi:hypothetical protein